MGKKRENAREKVNERERERDIEREAYKKRETHIYKYRGMFVSLFDIYAYDCFPH